MKSTGAKENRGSVLLSREENENIFKLIGNRCQCLAAGVIQLYLTEAPFHKDWIKKSTGVITLIRDNPRRSFFLRLYCLQRNVMLWEHEVYNSMEYNAPLSYFHTFEGEECMTAFNFADETEAIILRNALLGKLNANRQRRQERNTKMEMESQNRVVTLPRKSPSSSGSFGFTSASRVNMLNGSPSGVGVNHIVSSSSMYKTKKKDRKKDAKRKLTTADIGQPSNFRHLAHMGWNANTKGLELDAFDTQLTEFFNKVGVSEQELRNKKTRKFIYNFIEAHGGLKAIQNDIIPTSRSQSGSQPPPLPPGLDAPPPIPARTVPVTASPGSNSNQQRSARPLPPLRTNVPPAPPSAPPVHRSLPSRPPPPSNSPAPQLPPPPPPPPPPARGTSTATSSSGGGCAPPPPPPPPLPDLSGNDDGTANTADSSYNNNGDISDVRPKLMESIRSGTTLKKVSQTETKPAPVVDTRNDLLSQIRQGIELKPVTTKTKVPDALEPQGLAGALSRALAERSKALGNDSQDSTSGTSDDDDEWDD